MKIIQVQIKNYKSIKDVVIPFQEYGSYSNKSNSCFFVGLNETGKSSILEALNLVDKDFSKFDYEEICFKPALDENDYVELFVDFDQKMTFWWIKKMNETCGIPEEIVKQIKFKKLQKNVYIKEKSPSSGYIVEIEDIDLFKYIIEDEQIFLIKEKNQIQESITKQNSSSFLEENQKLLNKTILENIITEKFTSVFDANIPKVQIWKPKKEFLINGPINLNEFKDSTFLSIPLKNIFHISGYSDKESIKRTIERALKNQEKTDELKDKLSSATTRHINKIWKEHKIKIVVSINAGNCQVFIEDKDKKHSYFRMEQRSDGFQQFVSLILSLSAQNDSNNLKNKVILIDEPEVHLHPSGVRYMRDEILKIGKNNHVFVSTHSHYMVDTNCQERHWIVKKEKAETSIFQIDENTPIEDDDVLTSAFGLNLFKELLPQYILIVEGGDDKHIIQHVLDKLDISLSYSTKSAGGASKAPGIASLLSNEDVPAFVLFDDDKEGRDNRKKIFDNFKDTYNQNNVFTLRDLVSTIPQHSTMEDMMPMDYVKSFFETELDTTFTIDDSKAIIIQLKQQSEALKNKHKLESLKVKLSKKFVEDFATKTKIENDAPRMKELTNQLIIKWTNE
ncbi:ATP-dependent endonuclease [Tenacibaculum sp. 47A_GOM-205m]|uniref:ATP-dependent nuclease n=1 Tax=Tenacibaculum sp. 47A_GOM-205m TaxID=1380384 RepID=UPI00048EA1E8|nr:AAA family ATPase [Tenacibaculum sp. 47A_GOM-205m]